MCENKEFIITLIESVKKRACVWDVTADDHSKRHKIEKAWNEGAEEVKKNRFTKNLSSDKINLSTFRGEGELTNLQLDENVLTDLLELPSWLRLTSAWCNHVSFRISWTKLKSVPITLTLDEVNIVVETCENIRKEATSSSIQGLSVPQGKYSFIHKVIDGITITVNTVNVKFISSAFTGSVQMSRIRVESKTPKWLNGDLRVTRLKDPQKGIILVFKEVSWQTVRIEASSTQDKTLTPLRLLTNHARCRITIRKRISDCSVLASRLVLILDDLLWVLTDSQLKAALHFVDSLSGLIKTATAATQKTKAQRKLETLPEYQAQIAQQSRQAELGHTASTQKMFNAFDVRETSYHFFSQRIDLHLCDDEGDGRSNHPELRNGGALQISVQGFQVDYYPYHLAKTDRSHWAKYKETTVPPALWLEQSLNVFREAVLNLSQPHRPSSHAPLERIIPLTSQQYYNASYSACSSTGNAQQYSTGQKTVLDNLAKLMSACIVLRIEDFTLYRVTTSGKKQIPKEFVAGDKDRYSFPPEMPLIHAEFTYFYYPGDFIFPLPPTKIFIYANPVQVHFDLSSILWFNSFALNLHESLMRFNVVTDTKLSVEVIDEPNLMYMDVKLEAIMPRVIIESSIDAANQRDRPKLMQIQISRFALTNIREMGSTRADLAQALHSLQEGSLVFGNGFPSVPEDISIVTDRILSHVGANDVVTSQSEDSASNYLSRYAMWAEPRDIWCMKLDPIWIDFLGAKSLGVNKSIPFIDAVPITIWIHGTINEDGLKDLPKNASTGDGEISLDLVYSNIQQLNKTTQCLNKNNQKETSADLHAIAHVSNLVSVQIDHYQYLFLLRLSEEITELSTFLSLDADRILQKQNTKKSIIFGCVIPQVEVTLVMPSTTPGKESNGGDAESVLPDSASLGDDLHMNSTNIIWTTPPPVDHVRNANPFSNVEILSSIATEPPIDNEIHSSNPNTHGYNVQIQSVPEVASSVNTALKQDGPSSSTSSIERKGGKPRNSITDTSLSKEINSGLLTMKKGFTSFITSIDSALKTGGTDDASDTVSIYSDVSSDSESYAVIIADDKTSDCMDVMFKLNPFANDTTVKASPVEVASEVYEETSYKTNLSSPSEPSDASSWRRRDLVSVVTFRLTTVELIRQNRGSLSSLKLQVSALSCDECGAIPWDELQTAHQARKTKFAARCRAWNVAPYNPEEPPCIQLRLEETLTPPESMENIMDKKSIQSWFHHTIDVRVKNLNLELSMSTVIGLSDLAEDEIITKHLPLNVLLENVKINLLEDRPPVNITSPGPIPINLAIGKIIIRRDESGVLHIQPEITNEQLLNEEASVKNTQRDKDRDRELLSLQLILQQLKMDNENLKKQLIATKESAEIVRQKTKQENDILRTYLKAAQDDKSTLLDEKETLLNTIKSLQQQLTSMELNKKNGGNR